MTTVHEAESWRAAGYWRAATTLDDLRRGVAGSPDRPATVGYHTDGRPREVVTYAELAARVERVAAALVGLGVGRGEVVTLQLPNCWELLALCLGCLRAGAVPGPVLPIMRRREVEFMARLTGSPLYVGVAELRGFSYADMSAEVAAVVPTLRRRMFVGDAVEGALELHADVLGRPWEEGPEAGELDGRECGPGDVAQVMFTSGTTGEPKGVVHTDNTLHAIDKAQADVLHLSAGEICAMGSPTTHQAGYTWNFLMPLLLGGTNVQVDAWDPELVLDVLAAERVSFFMGAPTFLSDLIEAQRARPRDLSALHSFATGSAPIPPVLVEQARDVLGCRLYALWGMTENGGVTITRPEDPVMRAAESDGSAVPGMDVRIVDEQDHPVPEGGTGRLQCRGAGQCVGYYRREQLYADCLTADGWFDTGDLARSDGHGGIRIAGRTKDVIVRGGEKIPAVEVEAALLRHPAVRDVAVVAYPDERLGQRACAIVVAAGAAPTIEDLSAHLAEMGMAKQYWPERLEVVEALPRTPSGKVQKFVLRDRLAAR